MMTIPCLIQIADSVHLLKNGQALTIGGNDGRRKATLYTVVF